MDDIIAMPSLIKSALSYSCIILLFATGMFQGCKKRATDPPAVLPGESWTVRATGGLYDLRDITTDGSILVAVGDSGRIITSADSGKSWTLRSTPTGANLRGVTHTNTHGFVAVSNSGGGDTVVLSSDGTNWTAPPTTGITVNLNCITGYGTNLVAVGCNGSIFSSSNSISWTQRVSGGVCVQAVERVGLATVEYVAAGEGGLIVSSPEGLAWTPRTSGVTNWFRGIAGGCSKIVAVGDGGVIRSSTNATSWAAAGSIGADLNAIACSGNTFVAVGKNGGVHTSHDAATTWVQRTSPTTKELLAVVRIGNTYVAVGLDGTAITSP